MLFAGLAVLLAIIGALRFERRDITLTPRNTNRPGPLGPGPADRRDYATTFGARAGRGLLGRGRATGFSGGVPAFTRRSPSRRSALPSLTASRRTLRVSVEKSR